MKTKNTSSNQRTAADLMTRDVITVSQNLPAAEAVRVLVSKSIGGVPVVDGHGRCVGIFSTSDFTRVADQFSGLEAPPIPCPFQQRHRCSDSSETTLCSLSPGLCPLQRPVSENGHSTTVCSYPQEIVVEWQAIQSPISPNDPVLRWMTSLPITVKSTATLSECAATMVHAHIHRLVVVDEKEKFVGLLSSTDLLKELAAH